MNLLSRKKHKPKQKFTEIISAPREEKEFFSIPHCEIKAEYELYERLRATVPVIDAALMKIVRLTGGYKIISSDEYMQKSLDEFMMNVPAGLTGRSIQAFTDCYLSDLLTYGNAVGEIITDESTGEIISLYLGRADNLEIKYGNTPAQRNFLIRKGNSLHKIKCPERILFTALNSVRGKGSSVLQGLPALSGILLRIYQCIGQNFDRAGNVRYAVTYKPASENGECILAKERAEQIAKEWSDGMTSARYGNVKDFIAVGDIDIKVIGAENQLCSTEIPVRQLLEQLIAKLSIPPFLLGLNWSSTERMSAQQADILTSELEYYRRLLTPVICRIGNAFLRSKGSMAECSVEWADISLQDETELAEARLKNAQAKEIENRIKENENKKSQED